MAFRLDIERLLCALLDEDKAIQPRMTDGLIFRRESYGAHRVELAGMAIYIDGQRVDSFCIRLGFDPPHRRLLSGKASIGFRDCPPAPYGTPEHGRLENQLLADPFARHNWRHRYVGDSKGWRCLQN